MITPEELEKLMEGHAAEVRRIRAELNACVDHFKVVNDERHRLKNASQNTVCAFCKVRFDESGTDLISQHVLECEQHPLGKENSRLRTALEEIAGSCTLWNARYIVNQIAREALGGEG